MRYEHWDILLHYEGGEGPMHEFGTRCGVGSSIQKGVKQPIVSCFTPTVEEFRPFQITFHCWKNLDIREGLFAPGDPKGVSRTWEIVVVVNGFVQCTRVFGQDEEFPYVINPAEDPEQQEWLSFPPTMPDNSHFELDDMAGRIRISLIERMHDAFGMIMQEKPVACFMWLHAPRDILQLQGIAYPSPQLMQQVQNAGPPAPGFGSGYNPLWHSGNRHQTPNTTPFYQANMVRGKQLHDPFKESRSTGASGSSSAWAAINMPPPPARPNASRRRNRELTPAPEARSMRSTFDIPPERSLHPPSTPARPIRRSSRKREPVSNTERSSRLPNASTGQRYALSESSSSRNMPPLAATPLESVIQSAYRDNEMSTGSTLFSPLANRCEKRKRDMISPLPHSDDEDSESLAEPSPTTTTSQSGRKKIGELRLPSATFYS